jgi:hypothetical protein
MISMVQPRLRIQGSGVRISSGAPKALQIQGFPSSITSLLIAPARRAKRFHIEMERTRAAQYPACVQQIILRGFSKLIVAVE